MRTDTPVTIQRADYCESAWRLPRTRLYVELAPLGTRVRSTLTLERVRDEPLVLDGVDASGGALRLESIALDGRLLEPDEYTHDEARLRITNLPEQAELVIVTHIDPDTNTALEGLYRSSGNFCTQCEAEGFRKITFYLDRPDVLSLFDVSIEAPIDSCPVLLSNGNLEGVQDLGNGRHVAHWHDPHPKPCYLFALVAGSLECIEDRFTTASGRVVELRVHTEAHNIGKCAFAMASLKAAMRWDEQVYGFEYDLERFSIVAVDDFNMGAMENKGLNIFNSKYVLAASDIATDADFMGIEAVVAHEYFHNWTGNRITCRDWFQLSLKEGLTVFRDQSFTSDRHSATVKRIEDVRLLRARQFQEDAGPMAHPIRPDSYIEINNFYTLTVYEKGAEVIRMLKTLLGDDAWRAGMALYVERHDGTAATCDDFVDAMEAAGGVDLAQFRRWYSTAGTPELVVDEHHDAARQRLTLTVRQHLPDTPGRDDKPPLHIPLHVGLLDASGTDLPLSIGRPVASGGTVLDVCDAEQQFVFENVVAPPIVSLLRGFSAPVRLHQELDDATLAFLMANDTDRFNRWEAGQRLATRVIDRLEAGGALVDTLGDTLPEAWLACLQDETLEPAFRAEVLQLPSLDTLAEQRKVIDIHALDAARKQLQRGLAERCRPELLALASVPSMPMDPARPASFGERRLANAALALLGSLDDDAIEPLAVSRFLEAQNMTDRIAALQLLCHGTSAARDDALASFHENWQAHRLVIDKWYAVQAMSERTAVIDDVLALSQSAGFELNNPNRVRALIASFAFSNPVGFHAANGLGHRLLADKVIELDTINPQIAARLVAPLGRWSRFSEPQASSMRGELERIRDSGTLSPDVFELVARSLEVDGDHPGGTSPA